MIAPALVAAFTATIPAIGVLLAWRRPSTFASARGRHTRRHLAAQPSQPAATPTSATPLETLIADITRAADKVAPIHPMAGAA